LPNPIKVFADEKGIDSIEVEKFDEESVQKILSYNLDEIVVFSFGKIIPKSILNGIKCPINIHPSPLPLYRGASPIERQLLDGVSKSSVTIMKMNEKLDEGEIIFQEFFDVDILDDYYSFLEKVYRVGIPLLKKTLECCKEDNCPKKPQEGTSTYAKKIKNEEEFLDFNLDALSVHNKVRALTRMGAYAFFRGKKIKIFKTEPLLDIHFNVKSGTIVKIEKEFFIVSCKEGAVKVLELQLEGKKRMTAKDFINGYRIKENEVLNENCSSC